MKVGVVGAGPAGALASYHLARGGAEVTAFDASHPREKPCGGGLTQKALALLPPPPPDDPLPARCTRRCRFESTRFGVDLDLEIPVAIAARSELDGWILRLALKAGTTLRRERVLEVDRTGGLRTARGWERFDFVIGADGASSVVRRSLLGPSPKERRMIAAGWFARGDAPMLVRFLPGLAGYLWLFPRFDHVGVGICAPLGSLKTREMLGRLETEVARCFPALSPAFAGQRYAHTIPSPSPHSSSILEIAGERWALLGDAAALADPITGEGITYALRSAVLLAESLRGGSLSKYPRLVLEDFGRDLLKAASLRERFYKTLASRMVDYSARSPVLREVLRDLVLGQQGYVGLKRRLLRSAPQFLWEAGASRLRGGYLSAGSGGRP